MAALPVAVLERDAMTRAQTRCAAVLYLALLVSIPPALTAAPIFFFKGGAVSSLCRLLLGVWEKEGSSVDPDGKLATSLRSCAKADEGVIG